MFSGPKQEHEQKLENLHKNWAAQSTLGEVY